MVATDAEMRRLCAAFRARLAALEADLEPPPADRRGEVEGLVAACEALLGDGTGRVGTWETRLLAAAADAAAQGFLKLAVVLLDQAVRIHLLPRDQYDFGLERVSRP